MTCRSTTLHGYRLDLHVNGPDDAPQLVFVHGMMESIETWLPVLHRLSPHYRCIRIALPWNGRQDSLWGRTLPPDGWLGAAVRHFKLCPDAWIAHSFGASALISLLATDRTVPGAAAPTALISPFHKASQEDIDWQLFQRHVDDFQKFIELSIVSRTPRALMPDVLRRMVATAREAFGTYAWIEFWRLFSSMPFLSLREVRQQTLVISGADDLCARLPDVSELVATLPSARLELFHGAGHFLLNSHCRTTVDHIERFLSAQFPEPSSKLRASANVRAESSRFMETTV